MRLLALVALCPLPAGAWAFQTTPGGAPLYWDAMPVRYRVHPGLAPDAADRLEVLRRGPEAWTLSPAAVSFAYEGVSEGDLAGDSVTELAFVSQGWPAVFGDPDIVTAATVLTSSDATGVVTEADVAFNDVTFAWSDGDADPAALDTWSIAAHEAGHVLGLDHTCDAPGQPACDGAPARLRFALMFPAATPGETARRSPNADDLEGLATVYGPEVAPVPEAAPAAPRCPDGVVVLVALAERHEWIASATGAVHAASVEGPEVSTAELEPGTWDLVAHHAGGKSRTFYRLATLPLDCPGEEPVGCCPGGSPAVLLLGLGLVGWRRAR